MQLEAPEKVTVSVKKTVYPKMPFRYHSGCLQETTAEGIAYSLSYIENTLANCCGIKTAGYFGIYRQEVASIDSWGNCAARIASREEGMAHLDRHKGKILSIFGVRPIILSDVMDSRTEFRTSSFVDWLILRKIGNVTRCLFAVNPVHEQKEYASYPLCVWTWCPDPTWVINAESEVFLSAAASTAPITEATKKAEDRIKLERSLRAEEANCASNAPATS